MCDQVIEMEFHSGLRKVAMPSNRRSSALNCLYLLLIGQFARTQTLANKQQCDKQLSSMWKKIDRYAHRYTDTLPINWPVRRKCKVRQWTKTHSVFVTTTDSIAHYRSYIQEKRHSLLPINPFVCVGAGAAANEHNDAPNISCYRHERSCIELYTVCLFCWICCTCVPRCA